MNHFKKILLMTISLILFSIVAYSVDFVGMLASNQFYGNKIGFDVKVILSFKGTPSTEVPLAKEKNLKLPKGYILVSDVDIPTQQGNDIASASGDKIYQPVSALGVELNNPDDWNIISGNIEDKVQSGVIKAGSLHIQVYSIISNNIKQIGDFECSQAWPVQYDANQGSIIFLCTDSIQWSAKCNTNTDDPTKQDWACAWNNSTVGE